jgi:hypothetical protein
MLYTTLLDRKVKRTEEPQFTGTIRAIWLESQNKTSMLFQYLAVAVEDTSGNIIQGALSQYRLLPAKKK